MKKLGTLLLAGCMAVTVMSAVPAVAEEAAEKQLTIGIYGGLDSLNPWSSGRITKDMVTYVLYETLASCQSGATDIDPILLKSWEKVSDESYDCEIYDYIYDAAGNNITAEDVKFSIEEYAKNWTVSLGSVEVTGDYTFTVNTSSTAAGSFEYIACKAPIASKAAFEASPDGFATTSCGTAQYVVEGGEDYVAGATIVARKTDSYWQTDESLVYPGSVAESDVIEFDILSDSTQMALAIEQGNIDFAQYVATSYLDEVSAAGITLSMVPSSEDRGIMFNMTDGSIFHDNLALRQAILYAIDNETVAEMCGYGYGAASTVTCGNKDLTVGYSADWETSPYAYDPDKAAELLKEAGYEPGQLNIRLLCNSNETITNMWLAIQANLSAIGINAELNVVEGTSYGTARDASSGDNYELAYAGLDNGGYVTTGFWNDLCHSTVDAERSWFGYKDETLRGLYDAIAAVDGYTQENIDAMYNYLTDEALYYRIYDLPEYVGYSEDVIEGYYLDWNRFVRANTIIKR